MLVPILLGCVCVLVVTFYLQYKWRHRRVLEAASKLPCPPTLPLIGNAHYLIGEFADNLKNSVDWTNKYKGLFCLWMGPSPFVVVSNYADAKIILNNSATLEKSDIYKYMRTYLGEGLVSGQVSFWKKHRRLMNPLFQSSNLERYLVVFNETGRSIVKSLDLVAGKSPIDPISIIVDNLLNNNIATGFGRNITINKDAVKNLLEWVEQSFITRFSNPLYDMHTIFKLFNWSKVHQAESWISSIKSGLAKAIHEYKFAEFDNPKEWATILDIWYQNSSDSSEDSHWIDDCFTLLAAATDTTATSLYLLITSLAANQDIQEKVYSEIKEVVGSREGDLTLSDLNSLTYLGHAITESMRLHGVAPFIGRVATKDVKLTNFTLPAGSNVLIALYAMGWTSDVFHDPHVFNPDRFMTEDNEEMLKHAMPFSAGPRGCIGQKFTILVMKTIMVNILSKYKVKTTVRLEDIKCERGFIYHPKPALLIDFQARVGV